MALNLYRLGQDPGFFLLFIVVSGSGLLKGLNPCFSEGCSRHRNWQPEVNLLYSQDGGDGCQRGDD